MKYYVRQTRFIPSNNTTLILYKRYKCVDGFCPDPSLCWQFSRQGAKKIVQDLNNEYKVAVNSGRIQFDMVPAE